MYIVYKLKPEHEFVHVVHANNAIHSNEGMLTLVCEDNEAPSHWNFIKEEFKCGVYHQNQLNTVLYPNHDYSTFY